MNEATTKERLYSIREAAVEVGISESTLRRWELQGQITPRRVGNRQRIFTETDIEKLRSLKARRL